jgi:hypothetical protein
MRLRLCLRQSVRKLASGDTVAVEQRRGGKRERLGASAWRFHCPTDPHCHCEEGQRLHQDFFSDNIYVALKSDGRDDAGQKIYGQISISYDYDTNY